MNTDVTIYLVPAVLVVAFLVVKRLGQLKPEDARRMVNEGALLVDVRIPGEFRSGHVR